MRPLLIFLIIAALLIATAPFASAQGFGGADSGGLNPWLPSDVLRAPLKQSELAGYGSEQSPAEVHLLFRHFRPKRRLIEQPSIAKLSDSSRPTRFYALPQRSRIRQTARHHRKWH